MKSSRRGKRILKPSNVKVSGITEKGIWMLVNDREFFLSFKEFPWFQKGTPQQIFNVVLWRNHHLEWPDLDVDLELESLTHQEKYPLSYQ